MTLAAVVVLTGTAGDGLSELLAQYLAATLSFTTSDQALVLAVLAVCGLATQLVVLPAVVISAGEPAALAAGAASAALAQALLALAPSRPAALAAVAVGALGGMVAPAAAAVKSNHAGAHEQGEVQGALAAGAGPVLYAALYYAFGGGRGAGALAAPWIPFAVGACLCAGALALALSIDPAAGRGRDSGGSSIGEADALVSSDGGTGGEA